jgi:ketosteroid isomerase-like protein
MTTRFTLLLACTVAALSLTACTRQADRQVDKDAARSQIEQLLDKYFQSVKMADVALASTIWLQSPDVVVVTPLGRFQGWDSVQKDLYVNFLQKAFLERDLRPSNVHIQVNGNSAWAVFDWDFTAKLANGQPFTSKGWESHVYEKTDGGWRIAHLHYSGQPPSQQ